MSYAAARKIMAEDNPRILRPNDVGWPLICHGCGKLARGDTPIVMVGGVQRPDTYDRPAERTDIQLCRACAEAAAAKFNE